MRVLAVLSVLLALSGCVALRRDLPVPASTGDGVAVTPAGPDGSIGQPPTSPVTPAPAAPSPAAPPSTPAATPPAAPPVATTPAPLAPLPVPSPALTASLPPAEMRRLQEDAQRRIEETERLLRQIEKRPFAPKEIETLRLAQSLVEQARRALGAEAYERAANLAAKARTLADDLNARR